MSEQEWLAAFAAALGVRAPSPEQRDQLLALAGTAAHAAERTAAPLSCWLVAVAGVEPAQALELAAAIAKGRPATD